MRHSIYERLMVVDSIFTSNVTVQRSCHKFKGQVVDLHGLFPRLMEFVDPVVESQHLELLKETSLQHIYYDVNTRNLGVLDSLKVRMVLDELNE